jgi:phage shock protein A
MLGRVGTGGAMEAFGRMEEKVLQMEAQAEAVAELGMDDLEKRIASLGEADDVEAELAAMKSQMLTGSEANVQLPAGQSNREASSNGVDRDLEQLRSQSEGL